MIVVSLVQDNIKSAAAPHHLARKRPPEAGPGAYEGRWGSGELCTGLTHC